MTYEFWFYLSSRITVNNCGLYRTDAILNDFMEEFVIEISFFKQYLEVHRFTENGWVHFHLK